MTQEKGRGKTGTSLSLNPVGPVFIFLWEGIPLLSTTAPSASFPLAKKIVADNPIRALLFQYRSVLDESEIEWLRG